MNNTERELAIFEHGPFQQNCRKHDRGCTATYLS